MAQNRVVLREFGGIRGGPTEETSFSANLEECLTAKARALADGDRAQAGHASRGAAESYRRLGRLDAAAQEYGQAIELFQTTTDVLGHAWSLFALGNLRRQQSDFGSARRAQSRALTIARFCGDPGLVAYALAGLAETTRILGDYPAAYREHLEAWRHFRALGDVRGTVWALEGVGQILKNVGNVPGALRHFDKAKRLASASNDVRGLGYALKCRGECLALLGDGQAAEEEVRLAVQLFKSMQIVTGLAYSQKALGDILIGTGQGAAAFGWYQQAMATFLACEDARGVAYTVNGIARVFLAGGDLERSAVALAHSGAYFRAAHVQLGITQVAAASNGIELATSGPSHSAVAELLRPNLSITTVPTDGLEEAALLLETRTLASASAMRSRTNRVRPSGLAQESD